jgi:hypothetical protein
VAEEVIAGATGQPSARPDAASGIGRARLLALVRSGLVAECLLVLALGLSVLAVHDVGYLLRQPFWNDEAWVAVTTRFPLNALAAITSSTPIGWTLLVRAFTVPGSESARLLPLAFAAAAVVGGYWLARGLGWRSRSVAALAGILAAAGALLAPAMLLRDDLKQYTADACMALLILGITSRLERDWSRRGLAALSVAVWGGMLLSDAAAFAGIAAFVALFLVQAARRAWRRLAETTISGAGTAAAMLAVYEAFDARAASALGSSAYWAGYYLTLRRDLGADFTWVVARFESMRSDFDLGPAWLAIPLVIAGLITIFRLGRPATALAAAALVPEMLFVSAAKIYPFGDLRTSTWLVVVIVVLAAIGVAGICNCLRALLRRQGVAALAVSLVAVAALTGFGWGARTYVRGHPIPTEDIRQQTSYVAAHADADDVILVNMNSNWGFAYYWPRGQPARRASSMVRQGYLAYFPGQPRIVVAPGRDLSGVTTAVRQALARIQPRSCARIWLVRTHVDAAEQVAWQTALASVHLTPVAVGDDGLSVLQQGGGRCG